MWKELGAATLHSSCRAIASSAECLKPFIASCSGKREHKRLERAWTKKRNHYEEQKILREYHELNEDSAEKLREFDGFPTIEELKENMSGIKEGSDDMVGDLDDAMVALGKQKTINRLKIAAQIASNNA